MVATPAEYVNVAPEVTAGVQKPLGRFDSVSPTVKVVAWPPLPASTAMANVSVSVLPSVSLTVYVMSYVPAAVGVPVRRRTLAVALKVRPGTVGVRLYVSGPSPPLASGNVSAEITVPTVYV